MRISDDAGSYLLPKFKSLNHDGHGGSRRNSTSVGFLRDISCALVVMLPIEPLSAGCAA